MKSKRRSSSTFSLFLEAARRFPYRPITPNPTGGLSRLTARKWFVFRDLLAIYLIVLAIYSILFYSIVLYFLFVHLYFQEALGI